MAPQEARVFRRMPRTPTPAPNQANNDPAGFPMDTGPDQENETPTPSDDTTPSPPPPLDLQQASEAPTHATYPSDALQTPVTPTPVHVEECLPSPRPAAVINASYRYHNRGQKRVRLEEDSVPISSARSCENSYTFNAPTPRPATYNHGLFSAPGTSHTNYPSAGPSQVHASVACQTVNEIESGLIGTMESLEQALRTTQSALVLALELEYDCNFQMVVIVQDATK
ncbi:hypothetical protein CROQUDRAFT_133402 [Cronartium quercuum f. sp. fusiforme G11]|uniref:Uncharacterized protein n=1 Tax=Cronartium quercuum f. sp. fusiforme G11 TaxID=708437 RepID=A0A9P6TB93_9BASI|nr:hypothetical protein CROQUDRAFT_133402 [Cronartium quercuum f. sp. fusiforme G11]